VGGGGTKSGIFSTVSSNQTLGGTITLATGFTSTMQNTGTGVLAFTNAASINGTGNLILCWFNDCRKWSAQFWIHQKSVDGQ
jgi:hypothetical protein